MMISIPAISITAISIAAISITVISITKRLTLKERDKRKIYGWTLAGLAAAALAGLAYARGIEPARLEVTCCRLRLPRLDPAFNGYRLVQISDIHMDSWMDCRRLARIIRIVNQQRPDLVVITGDFVTREAHKHARDMVVVLRGLRAADGVAAVLGNHDHWCDPESVRRVMEASGIVELSNQVMTIRRGTAALHLAGIDAYTEGLDNLDQVLSHLPEEGAAILLAHEPDFADVSAPTGRFDLQLSGHSHGGQVSLPVVGPPFLPEHAEKYPDGYYELEGMKLYTNRGLGMVHLPLRLNARPEISVFILESGQDNPDTVEEMT